MIDGKALRRALERIAHEILENGDDLGALTLVGIRSRGVFLARRLAKYIAEFEGLAECPAVYELDVRTFRDDLTDSEQTRKSPQLDIQNKVVVLVDDVIFTGRTARAAMDALIECGRPAAVRLAVLVDRGHRELPLKPDYVGKNVPTSDFERVSVHISEHDGVDEVVVGPNG